MLIVSCATFILAILSASLKRSHVAVPRVALGRRGKAVCVIVDAVENLLAHINDKKQGNFSRFCCRL